MAEISKITLPSGNTYDIKDATARQMIAGGVSFIVAWDGTSTPVVANIPAGVKVTYGGTVYTGTLIAETSGDDPHAQAGAFYLVKSSSTPGSETLDIYDEYVPAVTTGSKFWEKIGDTQLNLTDIVTDVSLTKQTDVVLGEGTTFTNGSSSVSFSGGTTDKVLGEATTFTNGSSSVSFTGGTTDTFVKSVAVTKGDKLVTTSITPTNGTESVSKVTKSANKLVTTTVPNVTGNTSVSIPNVTNAGSASTWDFTMGSGAAAETLIISGSNSTAPTLGDNLTATNTTLGTAKTVATGALSSTGAGDDVVSTVTISDKNVAKVGTAVTVATGATSSSGTGSAVVSDVTVGDSAEAITDIGTGTAAAQTITVGTNDKVTAVTGIGTGTAAAQTITVGTNDKVTVLKNTTDVSVTKGNA